MADKQVPDDTADAGALIFPSLTAALADAQANFPPIPKSKTANVTAREGKQGYSYSYADLGDVLAAVRPVLGARGIVVTQPTRREDGRLILRTELRHVSGDFIDSEVELAANPAVPQQFGGSLTYLRRYELVTLLGIAAEEDTDAQHVEPPSNYGQPTERTPPAWAGKASDEDKQAIREVLHELVGNQRRADEYAAALSRVCGHFPVAVAKWLRALTDFQHAAIKDEETPPADPVGEEVRAAAAGQPPPSDVPDGDPRPASDMPTEAELAEAREAARDLEGAKRPDAGELEPGSGTVDPPTEEDLARYTTTEAKVMAYRERGCICEGPLAPNDAPGSVHDDACPIKGHGIPF